MPRPKTADWRKRFDTWASRTHVTLPCCRFALHDQALVPAALAAISKTCTDRLLVLVPDSASAEALGGQLETLLALLGDIRPVISLPEINAGRRQWIPENEAGRCAALECALDGKPAVFLSTPMALMSRTVAPNLFQKRTFTLRKGDTMPPEELAKRLVELDYDNEFEVQTPGEFARRGGIMDIYSPLYDAPVRLEFWGDEIDSMRYFLPDTQRSFKELAEIRVVPRGMAVLAAEEGESTELAAYFPEPLPVVICSEDLLEEHLHQFAYEDVIEKWEAFCEGRSSVIRLITAPGEDSSAKASAGPLLSLDAVSLGTELAVLLPEMGEGAALWHWQQLRDSLLRWHKSGYALVACCAGQGEVDRFTEILKEDPLTNTLPIAVEKQDLACGLLLPEARLVMLSDREIFGRKSKLRRAKNIKYRHDSAVRGGLEMEEGAWAVHVTHGICIYHGIQTLETGGEIQEVIKLEFADESYLYVPLAQAHLISRYMGAGKHAPTLSRLGGNAWKNTKLQAANAAWDYAAELLRVEAMRQNAGGIAFKPIVEWERSFAGAFPYQETGDQTEAIQTVLADMENTRPMDRLLCGDVGYGKTEVAMRAAFRAVLNGKQVAVLVPTTILAQQHYTSFTERMAEYPVRIDMLSRFKSKGEQKEILDRTAAGEVDILIGTHRLLQEDVRFAALGLLIIDEEQRFGVKDKQRFKAMRANLDILTMTATPIPRTLYFSLSGLRNLSTIMTAPTDRLPVTTIVANYDKELIRHAIRSELERKGQVFFLYNRVQTIERMQEIVQELVPDARCEIAHGQMSPARLESIMLRFLQQKIDVLVCTTIIESGVDIPNVNTIIIDRADRFGLSELYQLRGRVGRHHRQAYAYMLLPPMGNLPANARERMAAIRRYTHLGAGFKLAMRDLEIRGAGNILGMEQSGHIAAVGFELYCQLLKDAVAGLAKQNSGPLRKPEVELDLDTVVYAVQARPGRTALGIPACYVEDEAARVDFYKRLNTARSLAEADSFVAEFADRFGPLPTATQALIEYAKVRILASKAQVPRICVRERRLLIETSHGLYRDMRNQIPMLSSNDGVEQMKEIQRKLLTIRN